MVTAVSTSPPGQSPKMQSLPELPILGAYVCRQLVFLERKETTNQPTNQPKQNKTNKTKQKQTNRQIPL